MKLNRNVSLVIRPRSLDLVGRILVSCHSRCICMMKTDIPVVLFHPTVSETDLSSNIDPDRTNIYIYICYGEISPILHSPYHFSFWTSWPVIMEHSMNTMPMKATPSQFILSYVSNNMEGRLNLGSYIMDLTYTQIYKEWAYLLALAPRSLIICCAWYSILTLQQSYTSNEMQDSAYRGIMIVVWFHKNCNLNMQFVCMWAKYERTT
jgi:hypothetical protein